VQPPTRRGFGTRLLQSLGRDLGGEIQLEYRPEGVRCDVEARLSLDDAD
jgi:two-component sensor histidine kinase